ncbi:zinc finger BED domain-containing protein RICESLEEPER 2-like [Ipomoea triloba]|uniref:zinc finger BED domain-containing protein RICESLEEPER 2-like n=1 Tax=Ipomoea triloba TaxID=35885 RepID=UPI00125E8FB9|nr:zinc finger BED domain-containing protein RICESLEEPER 2-like [Ipomoea triloba]
MHDDETVQKEPKIAPTPPSVGTECNDEENKNKKRKISRQRSEVWDHFTKISNDKCERKAKCNYCKKELFVDTKMNGTSSLKAHVRICPKMPRSSSDPSQTELLVPSSEGEGSLGCAKYNAEALRNSIAEMIINHEIPFKFVEFKGFRKCLPIACPRFKVPSRWTIARDCYAMYLEEKQNHKAEDIGKMIEKCLRDWAIDKVFTITVDNASSNDVATTCLRKKLNNVNGTILEGKFIHMRCVAHIINLVVTEGLKEVNESIARVRSAVRWNSTYLMLDAAQKFERAFERFEEIDHNYRHELVLNDGTPDQDDWENIRKMSKFLQRFYDFTLKISSTTYVTCNAYFPKICELYCTLRDWIRSSDPQFSAMVKRMKEKFDKYWGNVEKMNTLLYVATVLDPRKKYIFADFCFKKMYSVDQASVLCSKLKEVTSEGNNFSQSLSVINEDCEDEPHNVLNIETDFQKYLVEIGRGEQKSELDKYINEELDTQIGGGEFDILRWWKENAHRFPILSCMARDILAVPVSTVASESTFNIGGRVLDTYRSSLTPKIVQALVCTQDWLREENLISMNDLVEHDVGEMYKLDIDMSKMSLDLVID